MKTLLRPKAMNTVLQLAICLGVISYFVWTVNHYNLFITA